MKTLTLQTRILMLAVSMSKIEKIMKSSLLIMVNKLKFSFIITIRLNPYVLICTFIFSILHPRIKKKKKIILKRLLYNVFFWMTLIMFLKLLHIQEVILLQLVYLLQYLLPIVFELHYFELHKLNKCSVLPLTLFKQQNVLLLYKFFPLKQLFRGSNQKQSFPLTCSKTSRWNSSLPWIL